MRFTGYFTLIILLVAATSIFYPLAEIAKP